LPNPREPKMKGGTAIRLRRIQVTLVAVLSLFASFWAAPAAAQNIASNYTFIDLGVLPGDLYSLTVGVNDRGVTVGTSYGNTGSHGFLWTPGVGMQQIVGMSEATGINRLGQVAGSTGRQPAMWDARKGLRVLPEISGSYGNRAIDINDLGQVAGYGSNTNFNSRQRAWIWDDKLGVRDLGALPDARDAYVSALNNRGQVVGYTVLANTNAARAWIWEARTGMRDLGTLSGPTIYNFATDVNEDGEVVGHSDTPGFDRAWVWDSKHGMQEVTPHLPGGFVASSAEGIHGSRKVVGQDVTADFHPHPVLWNSETTVVPLPEFSNSPYGGDAFDINDKNQVIGVLYTPTGFPHAVLWQRLN
jgi:probable HAF family extracellular repeat protein